MERNYESMNLGELLNQLADMQQEVEERRLRARKLQDEIDGMDSKGFVVADSVACGKKGKKPIKTVKIVGFPWPYYQNRRILLDKRIRILAEKEQELLEVITALEEKIDSIGDSRMRRILSLRYIDGLSWVQVAHRIGGNATADSCRNAQDRFLGKR